MIDDVYYESYQLSVTLHYFAVNLRKESLSVL